ncbi:SNF2 family N-terminal domain-containing protein [Dactylonectria macrodidyma]|uniref:DNA helicase n=1 Tax=Dactylonectria macrodidyma TaxID=307937 RepID=A0A9P9EAU2_9HYPO|nr:SNF2 family N-terminal domain-containing protein [Dactylonectria macrodidyma]
MPEIASPDNVLPSSNPDAPKLEDDAPLPSSDGHDALNGTRNGTDSTGEAERETTPKTNGHLHDSPNGHAPGDERPAKRRRTRDLTPGSAKKLKPESPPWKRIDADGPTSFTQNGRRKSGRINTLPLELLPPSKKRVTRRSINGKGVSQEKAEPQTPNGNSKRLPNGSHKSAPATKTAHTKTASTPTPKTTSKKPAPEPRNSSRSTRRRSSPPPPQPTRQSARSRRSARFGDLNDAEDNKPKDPKHDATTRSPRIKLRVGRSGDIPLVHPDQVRKRPKIGTSFEDFWSRAGEIPVEDGGLFATEDGPPYTDEMAQKDARIILRIEDEVEPGGLLSQERCSVFLPEAEEEPPRQWARQDHLVKAMINFRKLMVAEQQRHRLTAKKVAEACRDEWLRRQPKSADQIEAEAREMWLFRYRAVVKTVFGTWENVRLEVNRRRLEEWEQEEQRRVKAALNEAVHLSEQKLQARQAELGSEQPSDEDDGFDDLTDDASLLDDGNDDDELELASNDDDGDDEADEDSDVMSLDEDDDADEDDDDQKDSVDEGLTQEQLRAKYANIPEVDKSPEDTDTMANGTGRDDTDAVEATEDPDTSDESVDMDDDMESTDLDGDDGDEGSGDDDSDGESDNGADGLLGMFFGKSELKQMKEEAAGSPVVDGKDDDTPNVDPDDTFISNGADDDEVSLVRHPDSPNGDVLENGHTSPAVVEGEEPTATTDLPNGMSAENSGNDQLLSPMPVEDPIAAPVTDASAPDVFVPDAPIPDVSIPDPSDLDAPAVDVSAPEPKDEDIVMTEIEDQPKQDPSIKPTTSATSEKPHAIETDPVTNPPSSDDSLSPPPTSETKLSDFDTASEIGMVVDKPEASRSGSPQSSRHKTEVPFLLRGTLREYQRDGLDWLAGLYANKTNGILADEMGLGKTIQTIALLAHLACAHEVWGPHLVIVPTSVMLNWEMEFKKWCPGFKILAYYGSQEERKRKRQGWNNDDVWNVCITSYQLVLQDQQVFKRRRWHYMILDEAHNIKNFKSQRWQTLLGFNTHSRLLLTGTPLQNNLTELWSLLFFLMPAQNGEGGFADLQEFHDWFHKPESQILESGREQMDDEARAIISKLHKVLRPYLLRRLKADVEKQMPGKYEHVEFCRLSKRQRELYDGFLGRTDTRATLASGNYLSIINCLMQLRKVCNHPDLFVDRPIMTSFRIQKSIASEYDTIDQRVRKSLLGLKPMSTVDLGFLNLIPTKYEHLSTAKTDRIAQLSSHRALMDLRETQKVRAQQAYKNLDPATIESNLAYLESAARWGRFEELQHCVYLNALRRQQRPIYGKNLVELLTLGTDKRPYKPRPKVPRQIMTWFEEESPLIESMILTIDQRADSYKTLIEKFSCVTPAVVTRDLEQFVLGRKGVQAFTEHDLKLSAPVRWAPFLPKASPPDPWHEARMRLSIQFPDKRLLQYDCGKLQILDKLLRKLQTGGHRALIFTQMTKVLDVLERFLNIHGHKYLRLDGATKVEQRQILTDRFNHDPRILCFILSTRSGGLGINLTGADTVIFYDQDWNPAMDKQCQDRCHRIGQTRDVHIYRLISEHTIEANILRKASQKQMLDDVVIQEGEFTTDHFNKVSVRDVLGDKVDSTSEGVDAADAALDRVLGGPSSNSDRTVGRVLEQAEDREDVTAARMAEKEIQADEEDFTEKPSNNASGTSTARQGTPASKSVLDGGLDEPDTALVEQEAEYNAWGDRMYNVDDYMLRIMAEQLKGTKLELPKDKKKGKKKGKDTRKR